MDKKTKEEILEEFIHRTRGNMLYNAHEVLEEILNSIPEIDKYQAARKVMEEFRKEVFRVSHFYEKYRELYSWLDSQE